MPTSARGGDRPRVAAAPNLLVAQSITDKDDLNVEIIFDDTAWLNGGASMPTFASKVVAGVFIHGLIKKPLGA